MKRKPITHDELKRIAMAIEVLRFATFGHTWDATDATSVESQFALEEFTARKRADDLLKGIILPAIPDEELGIVWSNVRSNASDMMRDDDQRNHDRENDERHARQMDAHARRQETDAPTTVDTRPSPILERVREDNDVVTCSVKVWGLGCLVLRAHLDAPDEGPPGACRVTLALASKDPLDL